MARPAYPAISGDEFDAFTPWRAEHRWRPGEIRRLKRGYWHRARQQQRLELLEEVAELCHITDAPTPSSNA